MDKKEQTVLTEEMLAYLRKVAAANSPGTACIISTNNLRAMLARLPAASEAEPVAWMKDDGSDAWTDAKKNGAMNHAGTPGAYVASRYSLPLYASPVIRNSRIAGDGEAEPQAVMRELLDLTVKAGRRCAYDLAHAVDDMRPGPIADGLRRRAKDWLTVFNPANGPKDYRSELHRTIALTEMRIERLEKLCKENGIDCQEF